MSFGAVAQSYDRLRPRPPPDAVDWLLPPGCTDAVDLAAGTGLLTREPEARVPHVIAVEPDPRMRAVLASRSPRVHTLEGTGEAIPLPDQSTDALLISSAWHWMDPDRTFPEIARVLRHGGRFGLIWTSRDREIDWVQQLDRLHRREPEADTAGRRRRHRNVTLPADATFGNEQSTSFTFTRSMTLDDVVDMLGTYSGVITADPQQQTAGIQRARTQLQERFPRASTIDVPMRSLCWRADRAVR
jgi:SAM-dependent methyltransferase